LNNRFEIDSKCPDSDMVNKVKEEIKKQDNSLLEYGTWAYLGSPSNPSGRYLFWTSVDTNRVGAGTKIPVIAKQMVVFIYRKRQQLIEIKIKRSMLQSQIIFIMILVFKHIQKVKNMTR